MIKVGDKVKIKYYSIFDAVCTVSSIDEDIVTATLDMPITKIVIHKDYVHPLKEDNDDSNND